MNGTSLKERQSKEYRALTLLRAAGRSGQYDITGNYAQTYPLLFVAWFRYYRLLTTIPLLAESLGRRIKAGSDVQVVAEVEPKSALVMGLKLTEVQACQLLSTK